MRKLFIFSIILVIYIHSIGQSTYFNNEYNYNNFSPALAVIEYNNDYILYGVTHDSADNSVSAYIASVDSVGTLNYWKTISEPGKEYWAGYRGCGLVSVNNSGFAAAGSIGTEIDSSNAILYRFNNIGDTLWTRQYSDPNEFLRFHDCNSTSDKGFIMAGFQLVWDSYSDILLVKTDSMGNEKWRREYGISGIIEKGYSVVQTPDKGFLIGYYQYIATDDTTGDPVVMKVDSMGNFKWERNIGGPTRDFFTQVCLGNDGSYIAGTSLSDSVGSVLHYSRIKIFKFSTEGDVLWEKYYGKTDIDNKLYAIYPDHDGGYIATGRRNDYYNPQGDWTISYGWLLKIDEGGDSIWYREYQYYTGTSWDDNNLYDLCLTSDGGYTMVGQVYNWTEPQTAWVIKVDSMGCDTPGCATGVGIDYPWELEANDRNLYIFPNPCSNNIYIRHQLSDIKYQISIYDLFGRKQDEIVIPSGQEQTSIDVSAYPSGIYVAVMKDEKGVVARGKFVKR